MNDKLEGYISTAKVTVETNEIEGMVDQYLEATIYNVTYLIAPSGYTEAKNAVTGERL